MTTFEARTGPGAPARPTRARSVLLPLSLASFVAVLDSSGINVSLPTVSESLALSPATTSWVLNAYLVAFGGLILLGGRLADVLPPRAVLLGGLSLFGFGGIAAAAAPTGTALIVARAVQGVGAALMIPTALALLTRYFPPGRPRARALGMWGVASGAGGAFGVLSSGILASAVGWRSTFLVGVLGAALAAVLARRAIGALPGQGGAVDLVGAAAATLGLGSLTFALVDGAEHGWDRTAPLVAAATAAAGLAVFVRSCLRSPSPLVRPQLARIPTVITANIVIMAAGAVSIAAFFVLPVYQQNVLAWDPAAVGLSQLPLAAAMAVASLAAPRIAARAGNGPVLVAGLMLLVIGLVWLAPTPAALGPAGVALGYIVPSVLVGAGVGAGYVLATDLGVAAVAPADSGAASGLLSASREVGGALGVALVSATAAALAPAGQHLGGTVGGFGSGYGAALLTTAVVGVAAIAVLLVRGTRSTV
jgi:MFS family permease